jgi:hypothetical protein
MAKISPTIKMGLFLILLLMVSFGVAFLMSYKNQSLVDSAAKLLADFPPLPVYPDAVLKSSTGDPHEGEIYNGVKYSAIWEVRAKVPDISKWYIAHLQANGWTTDISPKANLEASDIQVITFNNEVYTLNLSIVSNQDVDMTSITAEISTRLSDTREPGEAEGE